MTLLVLEIKVPELSSEQVEAGELAHALCEQWPHVFAYALSFLVIAATWLTHHNVWKFVRRSCIWRSGRTPDDTTCWTRWWNRTCM